MKKTVIIAALVLGLSAQAYADEGMWLVNAIDKALEKNMKARGLKLKGREIYDADAPGSSLCDAVVSLDFGCTGSVISDEGLVITNHHCAFGDVHSLSSNEKNYLEDGFWALRADEERHIPGKSIYFLKKVLDVTDEVLQLKDKFAAEGKPVGMRKLSYIVEKRYNESNPGLEASLSSMWGGEKYYLALYEVYRDIRLVAAPPVSVAAFGGDTDNWEWPQHKCDFALYRIYCAPGGSPADYSADNVPLHPAKKLKISTKGLKEGDFNMVIGYPGRTDRFSSSFKLDFQKDYGLPVSNLLRREQMEIVRKWMDADPQIRLKYQDWYFSLSNVQELNEGEVLCWNRFCVSEERKAREREVAEWISRDSGRQERWGNLSGQLEKYYSATNDIQRDRIWFRETIIRGSRIALMTSRLGNSFAGRGHGKGHGGSRWMDVYDEIDLRVEKDLFIHSAVKFLENVPSEYWSDYQKGLVEQFTADGNCDFNALAEHVWKSSRLTAGKPEGCGRELKEELKDDSLVRFLQDVKIVRFNNAVKEAAGEADAITLEREFTNALYEMRRDRDEALYPDANSTMRITYGRVCGLKPRDAVVNGWQSRTKGIFEKEDGSNYDFRLRDDFRIFLAGLGDGYPVNFLNDCDITGGNSGSPVLNARGELVGLAFDGNKESLASDASYTPGYNKCVCVDIHYVLSVLCGYGNMTRIAAELGLNPHFTEK